MSPRRVTVVAHELRGFPAAGGLGTATTFVALALARLGHSVEILLGLGTPDSIDAHWADLYAHAGVELRHAPPLTERVEPWHFVHPRAIELGLRERPPDVVVAHDFGAPAYTALRARQAGLGLEETLFVVFCHGPRRYAMDLSPQVAPPDLRNVLAVSVLEQAAVELADVVVSPSAYLLAWMRSERWQLPEPSLVIPHFTHATATGTPAPQARSGDQRLERIVFFGRLDEKKGIVGFANGLNSLDPELLQGLAVEFVGRTTSTWPRNRVEALLSNETRTALRAVEFHTGLDQHTALERLRRPGTLVVMPSLMENSPNAVYECLECRIPFLASNVGGVPELIATADRERVLFAPTASGVSAALRGVLSSRRVPPPARASFAADDASKGWAEVVKMQPKPQTRRADPSSFVFVGEENVLDDSARATLLRAQAASDADVVTCGVHDTDGGIHLFSGDPGALGLLSDAYGPVALLRRELVEDGTPTQREWPLLAGHAARGAKIVSVPAPLMTRPHPVETVEGDPGDALLVAQALERTLPRAVRGAARLAAGLAADVRPERQPEPSRRVGLALLGLTLLAAALRVATLGRQSYWYDELVTVSLLHRGFGGMLHAVPHSEATPYLYYVVAWPWTRIFGFGEAGVRSLSAVFGTLMVPVAYGVGAAVASRRVGLIAAAIVAVNPFLVWYSQEARSYALFALCSAGTVYFSVRALRRDPHALVGWSVAAALALAAHYFAVFIVGAEVFALLRRRARDVLRAAVLPAAVLSAEIPLILAQRHNGGNIGQSSLLHRVAGIPKDLVVGYSFPAELVGSIVGVGLVLLGCVLATRVHNGRALVVAEIAVLTLLAPIVVALAGLDYVLARNLIAVVVPAAVFVAVGYASMRTGIGAAALLVALSLAVVVAVASDTTYGRTDWRGAARALQRAGASRAIVVTPSIDDVLLRPYLHGLTEPAQAATGIREIDVVGLATQGGFSTHAVRPPPLRPKPAPAGFRLNATKSTSTYVIARYRSSQPQTVPVSTLGSLALSPVGTTVLVQRPTSEAPR